MNDILVFSGMPASGKDTITDRLIELDSSFKRLKKYRTIESTDSIKDNYYNISYTRFKKMINENAFLQYHKRYGRYYGIAKSTLLECLTENSMPIIHIGRIENYYVFLNGLKEIEKEYSISINVVHVQLWAEKGELIDRIKKRDIVTGEINMRIRAMEQEFSEAKELMKKKIKPFSVIIKNIDIEKTCSLILNYMNKKDIDDGYEEYRGYLMQI